MWIVALILSIKLNMPTWYWIVFTIVTILRPVVSLFSYELEKRIMDNASEENK